MFPQYFSATLNIAKVRYKEIANGMRVPGKGEGGRSYPRNDVMSNFM